MYDQFSFNICGSSCDTLYMIISYGELLLIELLSVHDDRPTFIWRLNFIDIMSF
jgi:hypothetical protein